jgi:hypothetical protein
MVVANRSAAEPTVVAKQRDIEAPAADRTLRVLSERRDGEEPRQGVLRILIS